MGASGDEVLLIDTRVVQVVAYLANHTVSIAFAGRVIVSIIKIYRATKI